MLVELNDVEAHIEPTELLQQALQGGYISVSTTIDICIDEGSVNEILSSLDQDDIAEYYEEKRLRTSFNSVDLILEEISYLDDTSKAVLLWRLLECRGGSDEQIQRAA